jgi:hypothetical protein
MSDLKTDPVLIRRLEEAATATMSHDQLREQRISFIIGNLREDSPITREKVKRVLAEQEGEKSAGG